MTLEALRKDMVAAMKAKDKTTKDAVSSLVSAVKKAAIDEGCREDVPEALVEVRYSCGQNSALPLSSIQTSCKFSWLFELMDDRE